MAIFTSIWCWCASIALLCTATVVQKLLSAEEWITDGHKAFRQDDSAAVSWITTYNERARSRHPSVKVKYYTFDENLLRDPVNKTYAHDRDHWLEFNHFHIFNASAASEKGFIDPMDRDCASTKYHALYSSPLHFKTPSVIRSNASSLAAAGLSDVFDVIAWTWKPIGPLSSNFPILSMDVWKTEGKEATLVDGMGTGWLWGYDGFYQPSTIAPPDYWPGWGEGGNWMEIDGRTEDGKSFDFCFDNLILLFYAKDESD